MIYKKLKLTLCLLILFVTCYMLYATSAKAQISQQSITVYPAIIDLESQAGETTRFLLQFRNNSQTPVAGSIKIADFTVKDKDGTPVLLENLPEKPIYAASTWISANADRITIPANDFTAVYFNARVPKDVKTCGNYALVYFENEASAPIGSSKTTSSSSIVTTKVGALVNFTIKNKVCQEKALISNLKYPVFSEYGPVNLSFDFVNKGDYHIVPNGFVTAANFFSSTVDSQKFPDQRIFPGALKEYRFALGKKWMLGRYQLTVNGRYGINNLPLAASVYIWVLPWRVAIIVILATVLLALFINNYWSKLVSQEKKLEEEVKEEKEEIERLKEQLKKRE